jgi:hypothetical protein
MFLDGTSLTIPSLVKSAAAHNKVPIIISCSAANHLAKSETSEATEFSSDPSIALRQQVDRALRSGDNFRAVPVVGTGGVLTFKQSVLITEQLKAFIERSGGVSVDDIRSHLKEIEQATKTRLQCETLAVKVALGAGTVILIAIVISLMCEEKREGCTQ